MTASRLKLLYEQTQGGPYFTRKNMKFCGDTMSNYYVSAKPVEVTSIAGELYTCWELTRRKPVKHNAQFSVYFDTTTFKKIVLA